MILSDDEIIGIKNYAELIGKLRLIAKDCHWQLLDEAADRIEELTKQRDELLAALERIEGASMSMYATRSDMTANMQEIAYAAIANVKEQP